MNILYFHSHDSGRYFPHYGYGDSAARELSRWTLEKALTFRQAFCAGPTCSPSRASLLTGQYPHTNGMLGLAHRGFRLTDYNRHLVSFLNNKGYETVLCGVQHEGAGCFDFQEGGEVIGYSRNITEPIDKGEINCESTAAWDLANGKKAAQWLSEKRDKPFFLSMGLYSTHREYPVLKTIDPEQVKPLPQIYNNDQTREDHGRFLESQLIYDQVFKIIIQNLEEGPNGENTIVIVTTDHGIALPYAKCNLNEAGMGVGLMIKVPGKPSPAPFSNALVSQVDLFPTLCDLLGYEMPENLQGKSFAHLFDEPEKPHRDYIFGEINFHTSFEPVRSVRTERYNYVKNLDREDLRFRLSNIDNCAAKDLLISGGIEKRRKPSAELYDLYFDPMEKNNLIDDPLYLSVTEKLDKILTEWQISTNDPLRKGEIQKPEGSIVNQTECIEPDSDNPDDYL
ncbi:MAG: sulfatase [Spirochaetales bacterium]|nr:sulfatase [Spirochaetales bacterium]